METAFFLLLGKMVVASSAMIPGFPSLVLCHEQDLNTYFPHFLLQSKLPSCPNVEAEVAEFTSSRSLLVFQLLQS